MKPWDKPKQKSGVSGMFLMFGKYDYLINISHPQILPLYFKYKEKKDIPTWCPLSDLERLDFEKAICNRSKYKADFDKWIEDNRWICPDRIDKIVERVRGDAHG